MIGSREVSRSFYRGPSTLRTARHKPQPRRKTGDRCGCYGSYSVIPPDRSRDGVGQPPMYAAALLLRTIRALKGRRV